MITVSRTSENINGTTAYLRFGDILSLWDLLHGLMLPSGNDAAILLSEHFGSLISKEVKEKGDLKNNLSTIDLNHPKLLK
jgi:D-alanyl-D-alanine carboxypeptidase